MSCVVSLRIVLTSMVLAVAIVAAAVSFGPLYIASLNSATDSGEAFSASISREIVSSVQTYFAVMQNSATVMTSAAKLGGWSQDDVPGIIKWMGYAVVLGADSINIIFDGIVMWTAGFVTPSNTNVPDGQFVLVKYNKSKGETYVINSTDLTTISGPTYFASTLDFRTRQYYTVIRQRQGWGNPFIGVSLGLSEAVLPCGAPIVLPNGTAVGGFYVRTRARVIVDYFLGLKVATTGRAMLVDPLTQLFVASNSPLDPLTKTVNGTVLVTSYTDAVDPLIRSVVAALGPAIMTCTPMPCTFHVGSGTQLTYVTVSSVNDTFNLNKRLVVMIPSDDFLGEIRSSANTSLGAAAGAVVGLLLLSFVAVYFIIRPLQRLEAKIYASVTLEEEDADTVDAKSVFTEILRIEEAYDKLQAELKKVKSFLPQSVLKQLEQQDEDEEECEDEGTIGDNNDNSTEKSRSVAASSIAKTRASSRHSNSTALTRSTRRGTSEDRRQAIERGRTLNTNSGLTSRMCTVVMTNMDGLHKHMKSAHELTTLHTRVMGVIAAQVDECKGVLDAFHGDRFTLTFNSSTNCASHCTKAAQFVMQVTATLAAQAQSNQLFGLGASGVGSALGASGGDFAPVMKGLDKGSGPGIRFGVATGKALCGNLGTDKIKRFCTLGPVMNHAQLLVDMCRVYGVTNLASGEALKGMTFEYTCDNVTVGILPANSNPARPGAIAEPESAACLVGTVREKKSSKMDEWMYELQEGEEMANKSTGDLRLDTIITMSYALDKLAGGDAVKAEAAMDSAVGLDASLAGRVQHVKRLIESRKRNDGYPMVGAGLLE
jgi:class 3 adenylate cyclase